jgi:hypothetical protein
MDGPDAGSAAFSTGRVDRQGLHCQFAALFASAAHQIALHQIHFFR